MKLKPIYWAWIILVAFIIFYDIFIERGALKAMLIFGVFMGIFAFIGTREDKSMVYIALNGNVYHKNRRCGGNTFDILIYKKEAISRGYYRCSKCWH